MSATTHDASQTTAAAETPAGEDPSSRDHFVRGPEDPQEAAALFKHAIDNGLEVEGLCGHRFVPVKPGKPMCTACVDKVAADAVRELDQDLRRPR